jgi:hypothetical protein
MNVGMARRVVSVGGSFQQIRNQPGPQGRGLDPGGSMFMVRNCRPGKVGPAQINVERTIGRTAAVRWFTDLH